MNYLVTQRQIENYVLFYHHNKKYIPTHHNPNTISLCIKYKSKTLNTRRTFSLDLSLHSFES